MTEPELRPRARGIEIDADKLRELREHRGLTQTELASLASLSGQYISQLETGYRRRVAPATYVSLCNILQLRQSERGMLRKRAVRRAA